MKKNFCTAITCFILISTYCFGIVAEGPDFMIIGAMKCGTTSLFNYLNEHPDIHTLKHVPKEIHFFDEQMNYQKGIGWYLNQFPKKNLAHDFFLTGEATPIYLTRKSIARRIAGQFPDLKIIIILRNPVDRALSHYKHYKQLGRNSWGDKSMEECFIQGMSDFPRKPFPIRRDGFIGRGVYVYQIQFWREFFPDNQFLILCAEELFSNPSKVVNDVFAFLGLSSFYLSSYEIANKGSANQEHIRLSPELREQMADFYAPYNRKLKRLLRDEMHMDINLPWK